MLDERESPVWALLFCLHRKEGERCQIILATAIDLKRR